MSDVDLSGVVIVADGGNIMTQCAGQSVAVSEPRELSGDGSNEPFEQDYFLRRYKTIARSYSRPVSAYLGECLEDLLIRAACENGFHPAMSYRLMGFSSAFNTKFAPGQKRYSITPQMLTTLLGNPGGPDELAHLFSRDEPPLPHLKQFFDVWLHTNSLSSNRRVSPLALKQAPFLRGIWRVWPIGFDPHTKETLLGICPECGKQLGARFMGDVWVCDRCPEITAHGRLRAVDLREYPQKIVSENLWDDLDFATSFIDPCTRVPREVSRRELHVDFEHLDDGAVFEIISMIARWIPGGSLKRESSLVPPEHLAAAARIVRQWPKGFEDLIMHGAEGHAPPSKASLYRLFYRHRIDRAALGRMKEIAHEWNVRSSLDESRKSAPLQIVPPVQEYLTLRRWSKRSTSELVSTVDADAMLMRSRTDIRKFTERLGISVPSLMTMAEDGVFPHELLGETAREKFAVHSQQFLDRVLAGSSSSAAPKDVVRLPRAVAALFARVGDPWSTIFDEMFSGGFEYWSTVRSGSSILEGMCIQDLALLRLVLSRSKSSMRLLHCIPLSAREAALGTRLHETGLSAAAKAGLVAPPYSLESLAGFRSRYEPSNLLSTRYKLGNRRFLTQKIFKSLLAAGIYPIELEYTGTLTVWNRHEIEQHFGAALIPCVTD